MAKHLLAAALLAAAAALPAQADPLLAGEVCELVSVGDAAGHRTGEVHGGPLTAADLALVSPDLSAVTDNPVSITLTCTVRLDWMVTHTSPAVAEASATGPAVAIVPPTVVGWDEPDFPQAQVCTSAFVTTRDGDTTELYWDVYEGRFTTDPGVLCGPLACTTSDCGPGIPGLIDYANDLIIDYVDPVVCPPLTQVFPPEGDVPDLWDCPPYAS